MRRWHGTILDTCKTLEGYGTEYEMHRLPMPASVFMTVDLSHGAELGEWTIASKTSHENSHASTRESRDDSVAPLRPAHTPTSPA
ncbi:hypothetical protein DL770_010425 [Monosporascus sp. CRB-9-2]|nr:hypothetical protein DL770_010425 [Monosporascus sp. CRB-9-2]